MLVKKIPVGINYANCYLVGEEGESGLIIDPGADGEKILKNINKFGIKVKKIILTHGHFDHIGAIDFLKQETGAELLIHKREKVFLTKPEKNLSAMLTSEDISVSAKVDFLLEDGDLIKIGDSLFFKVLHTPGHSPGGICLYNQKEDILFTGDTIFSMGIGRTDFPGSCENDLYRSIEDKLLNLPDNTLVYPGHGVETTINRFKKNYWRR